jgi:hypothetical protein
MPEPIKVTDEDFWIDFFYGNYPEPEEGEQNG